MNFTLCKNRCNYTKRNKQSRNPPLSVQPFQNRTIPRPAPSPLPYERSVGFASLQSPWAFNFGHPCPSLVKGEVLSPEKIRATTGGIASRCTEPIYPHDHCKRTITPCSHQPFQNRTIPRKSPTPLPLNECSGSAISQKELSVAFYHSRN